MKRTSSIIILLFALVLYGQNVFSQFVVAKDTIRGQIDFCPRPGDFTGATNVPNDSVFYLFPPDLEMDPWRYVDFYTPSRTIKSGYIRGNNLMRIDDYDMVEVERLSSHGTVTFRNDDVRVQVGIAVVNRNDAGIKQDFYGNYSVNGKEIKGVTKGSYPKFKYQAMSVTIKGRTITLPKKLFENLMNPEITDMAVYYNEEKSIVYIVANNGGTDAYYNALWAVSPKGASSVYIFDPANRK